MAQLEMLEEEEEETNLYEKIIEGIGVEKDPEDEDEIFGDEKQIEEGYDLGAGDLINVGEDLLEVEDNEPEQFNYFQEEEEPEPQFLDEHIEEMAEPADAHHQPGFGAQIGGPGQEMQQEIPGITRFDSGKPGDELWNLLHSNVLRMSPDQKERSKAAKELHENRETLLEGIQSEFEYSDFIIGAAPVIRAEMGFSLIRFLDMFSGGNPERVLGEGYSGTENVGAGYEEGLEKLESLARNGGNYDTDLQYGELVEDVLGETTDQIDVEKALREAETGDRSVEDALLNDQLGQLIQEKMEKDREKGQEVIGKRDKLKDRIAEEKRKKAFEQVIEEELEDQELQERAYDQLESDNPEFSFLNSERVQGMLEGLADRHLNGTAEEIQELADQMDGKKVEFEIYDKSLENLPYRENRSYPCTFPGSEHTTEPTFVNYMADPATQIATIDTEKGEGVALMKVVERDGRDLLYVHSVEADKGVNIASDKDLARGIRRQIEKYAEELSQDQPEIKADGEVRELEIERVAYSMDNHNNGTPDNFQRVLREEEEYEKEAAMLNQLGIEHNGFDNPLDVPREIYEKPV